MSGTSSRTQFTIRACGWTSCHTLLCLQGTTWRNPPNPHTKPEQGKESRGGRDNIRGGQGILRVKNKAYHWNRSRWVIRSRTRRAAIQVELRFLSCMVPHRNAGVFRISRHNDRLQSLPRQYTRTKQFIYVVTDGEGEQEKFLTGWLLSEDLWSWRDSWRIVEWSSVCLLTAPAWSCSLLFHEESEQRTGILTKER